jgi:putative chitinase
MNRSAFYASVRQRASGVFGTSLSQAQVNGVEAVLDEAERRSTSLFHLAAILSEIYHETGGQMQPVKETVYASSKDRNPPDATVIKRLDTAFAKGQLTWVKTPYWRDGWFGRGLIQVTHKVNYDKLGLTKQSALDLKTSVRATFDGMEKGLFTGKKLADYDYLITTNPAVPGYKYYASRAIVNGDTAGNGAKIAEYAKAFEKALRSAGYVPKTTLTAGTAIPVDLSVGKDFTLTPVAEAKLEKPVKIEQGPVPSGNWLSALIAALANLLKGK